MPYPAFGSWRERRTCTPERVLSTWIWQPHTAIGIQMQRLRQCRCRGLGLAKEDVDAGHTSGCGPARIRTEKWITVSRTGPCRANKRLYCFCR